MNNKSNVDRISKTSIGMFIFLSIITLGLYACWWQYCLIRNVKITKGESGGLGEWLLFMFIPFYALYWWYTRGEYVRNEKRKIGDTCVSNGIVFLILSLFGLDIINIALMQEDFNKWSNIRYINRGPSFDTIFNISNYALMGIILFVVMYPLYFVIVASISDPAYVNAGQTLLWPRGITFEGYERAFEYKTIWLGYRNSIVYTLIGTLINIGVLIPASFALSRKELVGKGLLTGLCLFTMYFHGGTVPSYLLIKSLGFFDTVWALVIPGAFSVSNMIICRSFFVSNVSEELYESVKIDGGTYFTFFFKMVLPLSKAIIAVMILYHALGHWNSYMTIIYYMRSPEMYNLQLILKNLTSTLSTGAMEMVDAQYAASAEKLKELVKYSTILLAALPMIILYPFVQKYFVQGVMIGSVKG